MPNRDFTDLTLLSVGDAADYLTGLKQDGCNGHLEFGSQSVFIAHDGDTCPVHEANLHYPTHEPSHGVYKEAIEVARELLYEQINDPEHEANPEYTRGVVNLIADLFGVHEMDVGTRMDQVAEDIGLKVRYE